ncbi:hypothetical protein [Tautonia sociabilis]|uniref:Uncharacterized protein n=1 Tax=Tautonia sociabilis TaxID=2080755 RepID=A0A432MFL2_9BACT|nr:hypothetical protein [Tautonia sociabilis]RUL84917.1 hypothetical protein TsocGM_19440 [Tautonia sociabilis]
MTAAEATIGEDRRGNDPLRRVALGVLTLYLAPALLIVLAIGAVGMAVCALLRWLGGGSESGGPGASRERRDGAASAVTAPHFGVATRSRSTPR